MATYVLQVGVGKEQKTIDRIRREVSRDLYDEVYAPHYMRRMNWAGQWRMVEEAMVPGYIFANTCDPYALRAALRSVHAFTKVLGYGDELIALGEDESLWLERLTSPGKRTVAFSEGLIEGERVRITSGPLMGYESEIARIDRHKRLAWLNFNVTGRVKTVRVGLEVVRKIPERRSRKNGSAPSHAV